MLYETIRIQKVLPYEIIFKPMKSRVLHHSVFQKLAKPVAKTALEEVKKCQKNL